MSGGGALEALWFVGAIGAIALFCSVVVGATLAMVLAARPSTQAEPWLPSLAGALSPEPSPMLAYLISVTDLVMATRAGFVARTHARGGRGDSAWLDEVAGHCAAVKLRGRALTDELKLDLTLPAALAPAAEALVGAWSDEHQMLGADGEWSPYHTALARVATRVQGESRHVWVLDRDAALAAVDRLIAACDPSRLPLSPGSDYEVDLDALDPDDRGRLDQVWPDASKPIEHVWLRGAVIHEQVAQLREQYVEFAAKLEDFRVKLQGAPTRFEVASTDLHADEPDLLVQSRQARDWVHNPRLVRVQGLERSLATAERMQEKLAIAVAAHGASPRRIMGSALQIHSAVYPNARAPVVIGLSRTEKVRVVLIAMVVTFAVALPTALTLIAMLN
ncbi:MAG: hypothetical protein AB8H79_00580 [Myxococcota bacterium]